MIKKPTKCITPKRDREAYHLTHKDICNLTKLISEANQILCYYSLMPENKTGELEATDSVTFENLCEAVEDLKNALDDITLT